MSRTPVVGLPDRARRSSRFRACCRGPCRRLTGREAELARLVGLPGGLRVVVTAIGGTARVGKTALAVRAAHRLLDQFPDGNLYADLRGYIEGQGKAHPGGVRRCSCTASASRPRRSPPGLRSGRVCCGSYWRRGGC